MASGIRTTVEFHAPDLCPIVELSAAAGTTIDSVATNVCPDGCTAATTEFTVEDDHDGAPDDVTRVFSHGSTRRYRYVHDGGTTCPCERLGEAGCPVARYVARDGILTLVFYAPDYETLRDIVAALRERFPSADVKRLVRLASGDREADPVLVDRGKLTPRQRETLETAYEMGYFERPRTANATEVAAALDISPSTFGEHLGAAEEKILADFFERE